MNIVVTGGAGYIGSIIAARLLEAGHSVTVLDNLSRGFADAVPQGARFVRADIADLAKVIHTKDNIEAVVHLAAFGSVGESMQKPEIYWDNNTIGSLRLLKAMRQLNIKKLVFASTCATYGIPEALPITEDSPAQPVNTYGMSKLAIDMAITSEAAAHGLAAASLRFFNVAGAYGSFGERHQPETHIIPLVVAAAAGDIPKFSLYGDDYPTPDGTCIRDYIHVLDLAKATTMVLQKLKAGAHAIYNLGNGNGFSNKEVIAAVEAVSGKKVLYEIAARRPGDPPQLVASSKKIEAAVGWHPEHSSLQEMMQSAWDFYRSRDRRIH